MSTSERNDAAREPIAAWWHTALVLAILIGSAVSGAVTAAYAPPAAPAGAAQSSLISGYLFSIGADALLLYWCWVGVHWRGGHLLAMAGVRPWRARTLLADLAVAIPFLVLWEAVAWLAVTLLGPGQAGGAAYAPPHTVLEIALWLLVSVTAGYCEEIVFRGYLQRQFLALGGNVALAVVAQAVFFGIAHAYKGWKQVIVIAILGCLYGALAAWRRDLRANVIAHALSDVYEGWLRFVLP